MTTDPRREPRILADRNITRLFALAVGTVTAALASMSPESVTARLLKDSGLVGDALMSLFVVALLALLADILASSIGRNLSQTLRTLPIGVVGMVYIYLAAAGGLDDAPAGGWVLLVYYVVVGVLCLLAGLTTAINIYRAAGRANANPPR